MKSEAQDTLKILWLEDDPFEFDLFSRHLRRSGLDFDARNVYNEEDFVQELDLFQPDIILSDHYMPQFDSISALKIVQEKSPQTPFILVTGSVSEDFAVNCIKRGAEDYVLKDKVFRLESAIRSAMQKKELNAENVFIRRMAERLSTAHEIIAKRNTEIVASIQYAQRIQRAILPDTELIRNAFPGSFVFFKPKDIIGGDFYWFASTKDYYFLAVGDCTGHGVPGSLLSMMGLNQLDNIVHVQKILNPANVLLRLNNTMFKSFNRSAEGGGGFKDGMDIGLVRIAKETDEILYSGAKHSLISIGHKTNELWTGTRVSIGEKLLQRNTFKTHMLKKTECQMLYMHSDGFPDQFGGVDDKKISTRKLRELFAEWCKEDGETQHKRFEEYFAKWKTDKEQTDDVLVMGIRVQQEEIKKPFLSKRLISKKLTKISD